MKSEQSPTSDGLPGGTPEAEQTNRFRLVPLATDERSAGNISPSPCQRLSNHHTPTMLLTHRLVVLVEEALAVDGIAQPNCKRGIAPRSSAPKAYITAAAQRVIEYDLVRFLN